MKIVVIFSYFETFEGHFNPWVFTLVDEGPSHCKTLDYQSQQEWVVIKVTLTTLHNDSRLLLAFFTFTRITPQ